MARFAPAIVVAGWWRAGEWDRVLPVLQQYAQTVSIPRFVHDPATRDDIAAQVMTRAWRAPQIPDDPYAWVGRVALNLARDSVKTRRYRDTDYDLPALAQRAAPAAETPEDRERVARLYAYLNDALTVLSPLTRECFVRMELLDESSPALARAFPMTPAAIRVRVTRARRLLREYVAQHPITAEGVRL